MSEKRTAEDSNGIPVVSAANKNGEKKKMEIFIIIAVALVLVVAVVIGISLKKKPTPTEKAVGEETAEPQEQSEMPEITPVTFSEDVYVTLEGVPPELGEEIEAHNLETTLIAAEKAAAQSVGGYVGEAAKPTAPAKEKVEMTTYLETVTQKSKDAAPAYAPEQEVIASFLGGSYYFDGNMLQDGVKTPLEIAMKGSDFQVFTEFEGKDLAMMNLGGKTYILNPGDKTYMELNGAVKKMFGVSDDSFKFEFNKAKFDPYSPSAVNAATYKGENGRCYTYTDGFETMEITAVDGEVRQLVLYGGDGGIKTILEADEFTGEIPSGMITLQGYSKANMISFFSSLM